MVLISISSKQIATDNPGLFRLANIGRAVSVCLIALLSLVLLWPGESHAGGTTWEKDATNAVLKYAEKKTQEAVKKSSKAAIVALYKRLYTSGADKALSGKLAQIALSTEQINQIASNAADAFASNDPKRAKAASEALAISLGAGIAKMAKNPVLKGHLSSLMGKAGQIKQISQLLGAAGTESGNRALAEYAGDLLINATPAAGVVAFYRGAAKAMTYVNGQFVSSEMEELYQRFKNAERNGEESLLRNLQGDRITGYITRQKMTELRKQREADIKDAMRYASPELVARLTKTTDDDIIASIVRQFKSRKVKEKNDAAAKQKRAQYEKEARQIVSSLESEYRKRYGRDWQKTDPLPFPLDTFMARVQKSLSLDGVLDPRNLLHIRMAARVIALKTLGKDSDEYRAALAQLKKLRQDTLSQSQGNCVGATKKLAQRLSSAGYLWLKEKRTDRAIRSLQKSLTYCDDEAIRNDLASLKRGDRLADKNPADKKRIPCSELETGSEGLSAQEKQRRHLRDRLRCLGLKRQQMLFDHVGVELPRSFYHCLCRSRFLAGSGGVFNPSETKNCPTTKPCKGGNTHCVAYDLPTEAKVWDSCMARIKIGTKKDKNGGVIKPGERFDDYLLKNIAKRKKAFQGKK